ncbi:hypothetical protein [Bacillus thuringiensis]|uniref:hypothetical protein n=1 Tax=Bacillus thuringiensis TaxID=1428 RepID=UPI0021D6782F|nr:hypothetical protein [Bacillus thuringiensis]MCU7667311.1 hypothetical protein [Bacillus thuringiensis]
MELEQFFKNTDYKHSYIPENIKNILNNMTLTDFNRTRDGKYQSFYFHFTYNEKEYILEHSFLYHWTGVDHWFKFKKPFFSPKPFYLNTAELEILSNSLMKSVNAWNKDKRSQPKLRLV